MSKPAELIGQIFFKLTVLELLPHRVGSARNRCWKCRCECGAEVNVPTSTLRSGRQKSCGKCDNFIDLTGEKFHRLTALYVSERAVRPGHVGTVTFWMCKCDCGNEKAVRASSLRRGLTRSCGCLQKEAVRASSKGCGEILQYYWSRTIRGAALRNLEFTITIEEAWDLFLLQERRCALSGRLLLFGSQKTQHRKEHRNNQTASLDRIDSDLGYVPGNVCWVHKDFNSLKSNWKLTTLISMSKELVEHDAECPIMDRLSSWARKSGVVS